MISQLIRAPLLNPLSDGSVVFLPDAVLAADAGGTLEFVGPFAEFAFTADMPPVEQRKGLLIPVMFDNHIHIPQHPIRGRFMEGVSGNPIGGRLLAGLNRNVFPVECKAADEAWARDAIVQFREDTLANGVIGGATYVTVHASAARLALELLPATWLIGLVLMNQNCPEYLRTNEETLERDVADLVALPGGGERLILTDRFAVTCSTPLRRRAAALAEKFGLRMQTHLNEQLAEKAFVEGTLYPNRGTYTDIYAQDGLLAQRAIMAHCIWMSDHEFGLLRDSGAAIAHCPTSNALLGSGIMPLDVVKRFGIEYAICTDVGASPTTSLLCEMVEFLKVQSGRSAHATATEALFRTTLAAARMLGLERRYGSFAAGKSLSFAELDPGEPVDFNDPALEAETIILRNVLNLPALPVPLPATLLLAKGNLSATAELAALANSVQITMRSLEGKIADVVVDGKSCKG